MTIELIKTIATEGAILLGAVSAFATAIAHLPLPWKPVTAFFARIGIATSKFAVEHK